jgi:hypothetical protein
MLTIFPSPLMVGSESIKKFRILSDSVSDSFGFGSATLITDYTGDIEAKTRNRRRKKYQYGTYSFKTIKNLFRIG